MTDWRSLKRALRDEPNRFSLFSPFTLALDEPNYQINQATSFELVNVVSNVTLDLPSFRNNLLYGNKGAGLRLERSSASTVTGNIFDRNKGVGRILAVVID
jgi:parallel beta-helix repeat protein